MEVELVKEKGSRKKVIYLKDDDVLEYLNNIFEMYHKSGMLKITTSKYVRLRRSVVIVEVIIGHITDFVSRNNVTLKVGEPFDSVDLIMKLSKTLETMNMRIEDIKSDIDTRLEGEDGM